MRDPAERLVSAFLNKCVTDGYMRYVEKPLIFVLVPEGANTRPHPHPRPFSDMPRGLYYVYTW